MRYNKKNNGGGEAALSAKDKALQQYQQMLVSRLQEMQKTEYKTGWITSNGGQGLPQNISGRRYSGFNNFFLMLISSLKGYKTTVFLTFKQMEEMNDSLSRKVAEQIGKPAEKLTLNDKRDYNLQHPDEKGFVFLNNEAKAFPVTFWDIVYKDADGNKIPEAEVKRMSDEERESLQSIPYMRVYPVFNIDQTNIETARKELTEKIYRKFGIGNDNEVKDTKGMYVAPHVDRMLERQEWLCPIQYDKPSNSAFYRPSEDRIVIPMKEQFNLGGTPQEVYAQGQEYYSTLFHEMAHSTKKEDRLNRDFHEAYKDDAYGVEELVAELTAATVCAAHGFDRRVDDNSMAYVNSWLRNIQEKPQFIMTLMAHVNRATTMILTETDKQMVALGKEAMLNNDATQQSEKTKVLITIQETKGQKLDNERFYSKKTNDGTVIDHFRFWQGKDKHHVVAMIGGIQLKTRDVDETTARKYKSREISRADIIQQVYGSKPQQYAVPPRKNGMKP